MKSESVFLGEPNVITLRIQPDDARCPSRRGVLPAWKTAQASERSDFSPLRSLTDRLLDCRQPFPYRIREELPVIRPLGHWRPVHAPLVQPLDIVLVHRLPFRWR